ncbi:unnamed protein product [Prunus brigantina]
MIVLCSMMALHLLMLLDFVKSLVVFSILTSHALTSPLHLSMIASIVVFFKFLMFL